MCFSFFERNPVFLLLLVINCSVKDQNAEQVVDMECVFKSSV